MSRILIQPTRWFLERPLNYSESHYESILLSEVSAVFDEFYCLPFKVNVRDSSEIVRRPDFLMIRKDLQEWFIVEVELITDNLSHVLKQVETFLDGEYSWNLHGSAVLRGFQVVGENVPNEYEISELLNRTKPSVMVVVNQFDSNWQRQITHLGAKYLVFQLFVDSRQELAFRISGDYPYFYVNTTHCSPLKYTNMILVHDGRFLGTPPPKKIEIVFRELTYIYCVSLDGKVGLVLSPASNAVLPFHDRWILNKDSKGIYHLFND